MNAPDRLDDWIARPDRPMPAEELMGVRVVHAEPGTVEGTQTALDPDTVSLGWFGVLADTMSGRGVACALPPGMSLSTVTMHQELVALPSVDDCAAVTASGRVVSMDEGWALGRFTVRGAGDRPLVVGTARFMLHPEARDTVAGPAYPVSLDYRHRDLAFRLGLEVEHVGDGRAELSWTPRPRHANPYPIVHGGLHAALADAALSRAVGDPGLTLLTLDLSFHRPIPIDGAAVTVEGRTLHGGRRTALAEGAVRAASGKPLTSARGSFGRLP